jgi:NADH-quinone oxidoreductase subunit H
MLSIIALDPLLDGKLLWDPLIIVLVKVILIFVLGLVATMLMVWFERKIVSGMQNRVGPNKAGPFGLLQTLADGMKLFFKEDLLPNRADRIVFRLAPFLAFVPAFLVWSVIPLGGDFSQNVEASAATGLPVYNDGTVEIFGNVTRLQLADPPVGILLVLALSSIAVYGIMLAGWASGSKYPLLGAVRASAQMISYEAALGLSLAAVLLSSRTLSTAGIVQSQVSFVDWNIITTGLLPFFVFLIAATAELNRPPFDLVEAEQELVGGFNTEYSGIRFALFFLAEFMNVITMSAVMVTLFLGGPQGLFDIPVIPGWLEGTLWFLIKLMGFLYLYVWFRATLPRLRYDQLMDLGWKILIPLSLGWFLLLAALRQFSPNGDGLASTRVVGISLLVGGAAASLFVMALNVSRKNREREGLPSGPIDASTIDNRGATS